jgi:hypothetical protein
VKTQAHTTARTEQRHRGRYSGGIEQLPDTPRKLRVGRDSDGIEQVPDRPGKRHVGRFSRGIEQRPESPSKRRRGSFADGYAAIRNASISGGRPQPPRIVGGREPSQGDRREHHPVVAPQRGAEQPECVTRRDVVDPVRQGDRPADHHLEVLVEHESDRRDGGMREPHQAHAPACPRRAHRREQRNEMPSARPTSSSRGQRFSVASSVPVPVSPGRRVVGLEESHRSAARRPADTSIGGHSGSPLDHAVDASDGRGLRETPT